LYLYAVHAALAAGATRIVITTDIPEVLAATHHDTVECVVRPPHLCGDTVDMAAVLLDLIKTADLKGTLALLQATSPLRTATHIQAGLDLFNSQAYELVMGVTPAERSILKWGFIQNNQFVPVSNPNYCFSNRQQLPDVVRPNGALYIFDSDWFLHNGGFAGNTPTKIGALNMNAEDSLDIDNADDFLACAAALLNQQ
jgi:CMP-N-acetylneuraminic acid synthetase